MIPSKQRRVGSRTWSRSLWFHTVLLGCLLVSLASFVGTRGLYLNDEGASLAQASQLRHQGTWFFQNDFPDVDPHGDWYALDHATRTEHGFAPLLRHPLYSILLVGADVVGGRVGIALLGILGTVVAAAAAGLIGREIRPGLDVWCLWVTGVASPLFFDSFIVIAHSIAAGAVGIAGVGLVRYLRRKGLANLVLVGVGLGFVVALRTEGTLIGLAMAVTLFTLGFGRHRADAPESRRFFLVGIVSLGATVCAHLLDRVVIGILAPQVLPSPASPLPTFGYLAGRINAFVITWLLPGYGDGGLRLFGPIVLALVGILFVTHVRQRRLGPVAATVIACGAWGTAIFWIVAAHNVIVPGLLPGFPLLVVGIAAWERPPRNDPVIPVLAGTVVLFAGGVLATQYAVGGTIEWGSRYLALGIPLVAPLLVWSIVQIWHRVPSSRRQLAFLTLVPLAVAPAVVSATSQRALRVAMAERVDQIVSRAEQVSPGDGGRPVVVTDIATLPRASWDHLDDFRWLVVDDAQRDELFDRLSHRRITQVLWVTYGRDFASGENIAVEDCTDVGRHSIGWTSCRITIGESG